MSGLPAADAGTARVRRLALCGAIGCGVLAVVVYLLAVRVAGGQHLDELAVRAHRFDRTPDSAYEFEKGGMAITMAALAALVAVRAWRSRRLVISVAVIGVTALAAATLLRDGIVTRPELGVFDSMFAPSFPSGHSAVAAALAFGLLLGDHRRTRWATPAALAVVGAVQGLVVFMPIHRPSDVLASNLLVFAIALTVIAVCPAVLSDSPPTLPPGRTDRSWWWTAGVAVGACATSIVVALMLAAYAGLTLRDLGLATIAGLLVVETAAVVTVTSFARATTHLRDLLPERELSVKG